MNDEVLRIGFVGAERDHRNAYPAALAALGDAADRLQWKVDVVFIDPPSVRAADMPGILADVDGLVLPGGSDTINVPGQILMARGALESKKPVVGLCLGMQTMTTAVAHRVLGATRVNLAEADPDALIKTFTAMAGNPTLIGHRLGCRTMRIEQGSRLAENMGETLQMRFNHRFCFNLALLSDVYRGGLRVSAWDETRQIVDAIEAEGHPFYLGLQGHPELSSKPGRPNPVMCAFLHACQSRTKGEPMWAPGKGAASILRAVLDHIN
jgi:CTP synthase